jgi:transposase InsO family protein
VELRQQRPDWRARKLQVLLQQEGIALPVITVHRILLRRGLVRAQDRHQPAVKRFERGSANKLWQMDFKSPIGWEAPAGLLSVLDDHSRYAVVLQGTWSTKVREQLEQAFRECGVPQAMLMDHGTPWWNMKEYCSGYRHSQTQGKVERFHGAIAAALKKRGYPGKEERQSWLDRFRDEYNHMRPHEALGMRTPASVWSKSNRRYDPQPAPWEYEAGSEVLKVAAEGHVRIDGLRWEISRALAGSGCN